jgi:RNA polymerase sigma factor (sigma-70 family)
MAREEADDRKTAYLKALEDYRGDIRRYLFAKIPETDVDDVEANILLSLWISLRTFRRESSLRTFIHSIIRRAVVNYYRSSEIRIKKLLLLESRTGAPDPDPEAGRPEVVVLSPAERAVFNRIGEGDTNDEISERLNISASTVRSHLKKIYKKTGFEDRAKLALFANKFNTGGPT